MIVNFEGQQHTFPDDATDAEVSAALAALPKAPRTEDAPMTAGGAYKAVDVGLQEGVAGLASLPRTIGTLGAQGIQGAANWVSRKLGLPEDIRDLEKQEGMVKLPTYESALKTIQDPKGMFKGEPYTPQNTGEEYLRTLGQFAPNVAFGAGGVLRGVVAPALASETAGQLTKGYGAEPYARMAGGVLGAGAAAGLANTARTARGFRGVPALNEVGPAVDQGYTAARTAGVELNPTFVSQGLNDITRGLTSGPNARAPRLIPGTLGLIDDEARALAPAAAPAPGAMAAITKVAPAGPAARPPVDFTRLDALRRDLGEMARDFTNPTEQAAARIAQTRIDDLLEAAGRTPGAVLRGDANLLAQTAREARGNAAAEFRMRALEAVRQRAEDQAGAAHSGRNVENAYRQQLKAFVRPDNKGVSPAQKAGLTRDEITEIRQATRGTSFPNLLRTFGNLLGGGGGIASGGLAATGYLSGDPRFYAAAGLGFGARNLSNTLMRSRADYLNRMVAARSPLAQQTGFRSPGPPIVATAPSLLSLLPGYQLPHMQYGGRPTGPTVVGEDGPEVFVPDQPGTIVPSPFELAAARQARAVRPPGGRQEGAGTAFVEGGYGIPAAYRALDKSAQDAFESAGSLQRGGSYDPAPVVAQALGAAGAPLVGPAMKGAVLGSGAIKPIRAYHGSPHDFERFDLSKIGTGEGAQAYGHGLYFAENPATAKSYRDALSGVNRFDSKQTGELLFDVLAEKSGVGLIDGKVPFGPNRSLISKEDLANGMASGKYSIFDVSPAIQRAVIDAAPRGRMYEVNINANPAHMLDWDRTLPKGDPVRNMIADEAMKRTGSVYADVRNAGKDAFLSATSPELTGEGAYRSLVRANLNMPRGEAVTRTSSMLNEAGIPGIKYLDQGSRPLSFDPQRVADLTAAANKYRALGDTAKAAEYEKILAGYPKPTSNYVLFRDDIIDIVKKYGIAGAAAMYGISKDEARAAMGRSPPKE